MQHLIEAWDGEEVVVRRDRRTGAWIFVAIHSTTLGAAVGGTRMKPYESVDDALGDALRLARGMSYKWAAAGFDAGGGKAVIGVPEDLDTAERDPLLRRYAALVGTLGGLFMTGPDSGTTSRDMDLIAEVAPGSAFCRTVPAGGSGNPAPYTALGVFTAMQATALRTFGEASLAGRRVLVQGVGSVGRELIGLLAEAGAEVLASELTSSGAAWAAEAGARVVDPAAAVGTSCDVFAPCALGGVVSAATIPLLDCGAVVGAANNQLGTPEDADLLQERGIVYAPDFVANCGGAIAALGIETRGWTPEATRSRIVAAVEDNLGEIFDMADGAGISTDTAARRLAERRLAMGE